MPHLVSAFGKLHNGQFAAAIKVQGALISATKAVSALGDKTPDVPERVARPLRKVTEPLASAIGSRRELATVLTKSAREWTELQLSFQTVILEALAGGKPAPDAVPTRPEVVKV